MRILQVDLLMLHHLSNPYKKNINYFAYFPITVERYLAFFGPVSKCEDICLAPQSATSSTISLNLWLCAQFFLIIKNVILIKHFKIKQLFWRLSSTDCKDALNDICQTLAFLLDISLKHCLFFTNNLRQFEFKWSENLSERCSPNFPG